MNYDNETTDRPPDALVGKVCLGIQAETATPVTEPCAAISDRLGTLGSWHYRPRNQAGNLGQFLLRITLSGSDCIGGQGVVTGKLSLAIAPGGHVAISASSELQFDLLQTLRSVRPFGGEQACLDGGASTAGPYDDEQCAALFEHQQRLCATIVDATIGRLSTAFGSDLTGETWIRQILVCRDFAADDAVAIAAGLSSGAFMLPGADWVRCDRVPARRPFQTIGTYPVVSWFDDHSTVQSRRELRPLQPGLLRTAVELDSLDSVRRALRRAGLVERRAPLSGGAAARLLGPVARSLIPDLDALLALAESDVMADQALGAEGIEALGRLAPLLRLSTPKATKGRKPANADTATTAKTVVSALLKTSRYSWPAGPEIEGSLLSAVREMADRPDGLVLLDRRSRTIVVRPAWRAACRALAATLS